MSFGWRIWINLIAILENLSCTLNWLSEVVPRSFQDWRPDYRDYAESRLAPPPIRMSCICEYHAQSHAVNGSTGMKESSLSRGRFFLRAYVQVSRQISKDVLRRSSPLTYVWTLKFDSQSNLNVLYIYMVYTNWVRHDLAMPAWYVPFR